MKIIIIGLGNFGYSLALNLTENGHEVFGIDCKMEKIDLLKDHISDVVCMDASNEYAYKSVPIHQAELGIVAIGKNEGASIVTTAILKKKNKHLKIISRSLSTIHDTILTAMGIKNIIHPEKDAAFRLTQQISFNYDLDYFKIYDKYSIAKVITPIELHGKMVKELELTKKYNISLITIISNENHNIELKKSYENNLGKQILGIVTENTIIQHGDILIIFGSNTSIMYFVANK